MHVKPHSHATETIGQMLHGIEIVPLAEVRKMVSRAAIEAGKLVEQEREACARVAEDHECTEPNWTVQFDCKHEIAKEIRDRKNEGSTQI